MEQNLAPVNHLTTDQNKNFLKPLKAAFLGYSGAGKTTLSMRFADCLQKLSKDTNPFLVIDCEGGASTIVSTANHYQTCMDLIRANQISYHDIKASIERNTSNIVVVDTISHGWSGANGVFGKKFYEKFEGQKGDISIRDHAEISFAQKRVMNYFQEDPHHLLMTVRVKDSLSIEQTQTQNNRGQTYNATKVSTIQKADQKKGFEYSFDLIVTCEKDGFIEPNGKCWTMEDLKEEAVLFDTTVQDLIKRYKMRRVENFVDLSKSRYKAYTTYQKFLITDIDIVYIISQVLKQQNSFTYYSNIPTLYQRVYKDQSATIEDVNQFLQSQAANDLTDFDKLAISWLFYHNRQPLKLS